MAIALTHLTTANTTTDATTAVTASITPTANRLIVVLFDTERAGGPVTDVTISGNGLTWSTIDLHNWCTAAFGTSAIASRLYIYAADTGGSPSAGAITFTTTGGVQHHGFEWSIFELAGTNLGASTVAQCFVQQVKTTADVSATSHSLTLGAAGAADNRPFCWTIHTWNEVTEPRANWTELGDTNHVGAKYGAESQWRSDTFETTASASWVTSERMGAIAFEIKALAATAVPPRPTFALQAVNRAATY